MLKMFMPGSDERKGAKCYDCGVPLTRNPYRRQTRLGAARWWAWYRGWATARKDKLAARIGGVA